MRNKFSLLLADHKSITVIRSVIYRSPAMVTVELFLVSLFVGIEWGGVFLYTCK